MFNPNSRRTEFKEYIAKCYPQAIMHELDKLSRSCDLYIFSGIIRDFFTESNGKPRDLDIVINNLDIRDLPIDFLKTVDYKVNQFGGLKINYDGVQIDVWTLPNTWGIKEKGLESNPESLIKTAFFNFSSIVYDYNKEEFIYNADFIEFMRNKELNIVLDQNPLPSLCIVSTYHYYKTKHLAISKNLKRWIRMHYSEEEDFQLVQKTHYGEILYSNKEIFDFVKA